MLEASKNFDLSTSQMINQNPPSQLQKPVMPVLDESSILAQSFVAGSDIVDIAQKFKSKMACVDNHTQMIKTSPGVTHTITIRVQNRHKHPWPAKAIIINETTSDFKPVSRILQPDETADIKYELQIPGKVSERTIVYRLQFANPATFEKFGDSITLVCELDGAKSKQQKQPKLEKSDSYKE